MHLPPRLNFTVFITTISMAFYRVKGKTALKSDSTMVKLFFGTVIFGVIGKIFW